MFSKIATMRSTDAYWDLSERKNGISRLREALDKAQVSPPLPVLFIQENALTDTSMTLLKSIISGICIPAVSIHMIHWKSNGLTGAGIFTSTGIWKHRNQSIINCMIW